MTTTTRDDWWHPKAEWEVRPNLFYLSVEIHFLRAAPRDLQTGVVMTLLPNEAKRIADAIIQAIDAVENRLDTGNTMQN